MNATEKWPAAVAVALTVLALPLLVDLRADFDPAQMVALEEGDDAGEVPTLLLVSAEDVLSAEAVAAQHALATAVGGRGMTTLALPRVVRPEVRSLDDLEPALEPDLDLELDGDEEGDLSPEMQDALDAFIATTPERFPLGMITLAERLGGELVVEPLGPDAEALRDQRPLLLERGLLNDDGTLALIVVDAPGADLGDHLAQANAAGLEVQVTGLAPMRDSVENKIGLDQAKLIPLTILANALVLLFFLRWRVGVIVPLSAAGIATTLTLAGMSLLEEPINLVNNVVPPLLITLGLSDAVHLCERYRELRDEGMGAREARRRVPRLMFLPCLLTSLTTAVGFLSLATATAPVLRRFGILAAVGVMLAFAITMIVVPSLLAFDESMPKSARVIPLKRPKTALAVGATLALVILSVFAARHVRPDDRLLAPFGEEEDVRQVAERFERELDGLREVTLSPIRATASRALARQLADVPAVRSARGPHLTIDRAFAMLTHDEVAAPEESVPALWSIVAAAGGQEEDVMTLRLRDDHASEFPELLQSLRADARALTPPAKVRGEAVIASRGLSLVTTDLLRGLAIAAFIIFVCIGIALKSPFAALIAMPVNLLPLVITLGWMGARGIPLNAGTAIVFTVSLGLAVDGTIHLLTRAMKLGDVDAALASSGRAVFLSALTLMAGFAVLLLSGFLPVRQFGELSLVTLVACLVADLWLLPVLLVLSGRVAQR